MNTSFNDSGNASCVTPYDFEYFPEGLSPYRTMILSTYTIVFILGLTGNLAAIIITLRCELLHTTQNFFQMNVSVAALCVCLLSLPFTAVQMLYKNWFFGGLLCRLIPWAQATSIFANTMTLCAISINRYQFIFKKQWQMPGLQETEHAALMLMLIWLFSALAPIPYALIMTTSSHPMFCGFFCEERWPVPDMKKAFTFTLFVGQFGIPAVITTFSYVMTFLEINRQAKQSLENISVDGDLKNKAQRLKALNFACQTAEIKQFRQHRRRKSLLLIAQLLLFFLSEMPQHVFAMYLDVRYQGTDPFESSDKKYTLLYVVTILLHIISMANIILNPVIYAFVSIGFRKTVQSNVKTIRKNTTKRIRNGTASLNRHIDHKRQSKRQLRHRTSQSCRDETGMAQVNGNISKKQSAVRQLDWTEKEIFL